MDDKDIEFAVKTYQKNHKRGNYTIDDFYRDFVEHKQRRPLPYNTYDPFSLNAQIKKLWDFLEMSIREMVERSGLNMAEFSRRYCIPYRTLQSWCDETNPCPMYVKIMLGEILKLYSRVNYVRDGLIYPGHM